MKPEPKTKQFRLRKKYPQRDDTVARVTVSHPQYVFAGFQCALARLTDYTIETVELYKFSRQLHLEILRNLF